MAEIVGIFATSHAPHIVREWEAVRAARGEGMAQGFTELGRRIEALEPDVILAIGADHWANFFLDNMPAFTIGLGATHLGPPEPFLSDYPHTEMRGHPELALHLAERGFAAGFEPSVSYELKLDHAFCVPFWKSGLTTLPPVVPVIINALQPPLPTISRCIDFGAVIGGALREMPGDTRVVILASGGLSHDVGGPRMGLVDEEFDRQFLALLEAGGQDDLLAYLADQRVARAGNGAAEVRMWAMAHGAAGLAGFEPILYEPVIEVYCGCGIGEWQLIA